MLVVCGKGSVGQAHEVQRWMRMDFVTSVPRLDIRTGCSNPTPRGNPTPRRRPDFTIFGKTEMALALFDGVCRLHRDVAFCRIQNDSIGVASAPAQRVRTGDQKTIGGFSRVGCGAALVQVARRRSAAVGAGPSHTSGEAGSACRPTAPRPPG